MKFGIHNSSRLDSPDPAEAFEAVRAKASGHAVHGGNADRRNDVETRELFASDVMPHVASNS
jgi:hypothetical protein